MTKSNAINRQQTIAAEIPPISKDGNGYGRNHRPKEEIGGMIRPILTNRYAIE